MTIGDYGIASAALIFLPDRACDVVLTAEYLITNDFKIMTLVVVDCDPQGAIVAKKIFKKDKAIPQQRKPH